MTGINQQPSETAAIRPGIGEYLLSMSHQLRAPLNTAIGMSGLLLDDDLSEKQRQYVNTIHAASESLSSTLNDLIDLARVSAGRLVIEPIQFDLKSMIEETASVLSPRANERGLALRVDLRPELPRQVIGDPGRTRQVLGNLIGHAVNSTKQGEVVIRVLADGERHGIPAIRFVVEDTGTAIAPERLTSLFDDFVPVDASSYRSFGVTGLGMRISDELVRLMGGEIGADHEPGRGNRYWFALPMPVPAIGSGSGLEMSQSVRGGRILVIEADPASRTRLTDQIESAGWDVDFASDLDSVVEMLREGAAIGNPFQACVFSHYAVRPLHAELATRLKADQRLASVALVMATAVGSPGEAKRLWHAGFAGYLRKPVPTEEVHETLRALERVGADGRGPAMITRHLLAEVRNAQTFAVEGIDEMLATLTAAPTRRALILGGDPADQESLKTATGAHGLQVEVVEGPNVEVDQVAASGYEIVVLDTRFLDDPAATVAMIRERLGRGGVPIIALASDDTTRTSLLSQGIDDVLLLPVREIDAAATIGKWTGAPLPPAAPVEPETAEVAAEQVSVAVITTDEPVAEIPAEPVVIEEAVVIPEASVVELPPVEDVIAEAVAEPADDVVVHVEALIVDAPIVEEPVVEAPIVEELVIEEPVVAEAPAIVIAEVEVVSVAEPAPIVVEVAETPVAEAEPVAETSPVVEIASLVIEEPPVPVAVTLPPVVVELPVTVELPKRPSELVITPVEGLNESLWESEPNVGAIEGLMTADSSDSAPSAVIEPIQLALPSDELAPTPVVYNHTPAVEPPISIAIEAAEPTFEITVAEPTFEITVAEAERPSAELPSAEISSAEAERPSAEQPSAETSAEISSAEILEGAIIDQLAHGGGFFTQHLVVSFLREAPFRIAALAAAATRGDRTKMEEALNGLIRTSDSIGAARLSQLAGRTLQRVQVDRLEEATSMVSALENAFHEVRQALDLACPTGLPAEIPAVGAAFLEQIAPDREGPGRMLADKLVASFGADAPSRIQDLRDAVGRGDAEAAQRIAQTLKGMCGLIGAEPLAKLAALVEADARLKRVGQAGRYLEHLDIELARVQAVLKA